MDSKNRHNRRSAGRFYEQEACCFLRDRGYRILDTNYYSHFGEIDVIAAHEDTLVFVEVKYRASVRFGTPETAVGPSKQRSIIRTAQCYLLHHGFPEQQLCRFDVIAIYGSEIRHFVNAFGG